MWQIPKAVVYRAIGRLLDAGFIVPDGTEPGLGPQRTVYSATAAGREAAGRWLHAPVEHVREIRSELLLKLALLDRAGDDPASLLRAQRAVLEPIVVAIESRRARSAGFDATLLAWRRANAVAALDFLDMIAPAESRTAVAARRVQRRSATAKKRCGASSYAVSCQPAAAVNRRSGPSESGSSGESAWPCRAASAARPDG